MTLTQSILLTGASGAGKSTLIRGALEYYGSGLVLLAPGMDEGDSYIGLEGPNYVFGGFDDILFHPELKEFNATGHADMVKWLQEMYKLLKSDVDAGKAPRYAVLGVDTLSAIGRLAYNATMARFKLTEPPAAIGSSGAPFYSYLRLTLESGVRLMRAIRGLGVHWVVASHPTIAEATAINQSESAGKDRIMPDLPGGFKNQLPSFFTTVLDVSIDAKKKHYVRWDGDPKRVTKSRLGVLSPTGRIDLPDGSLASWTAIAKPIEAAMEKLKGGIVR